MVLEIQADNVDLKAENVKMGTEIELLKEKQKLTAESNEKVTKDQRIVSSLEQKLFVL